jgi:hypothetical protein
MSFLRKCKTLIENNDLESLQLEYSQFAEPEWQFVYIQLFNHACNKNKPEIAAWLKSLYETFGTVDKIALRQAFAYGDFILRSKVVT